MNTVACCCQNIYLVMEEAACELEILTADADLINTALESLKAVEKAKATYTIEPIVLEAALNVMKENATFMPHACLHSHVL